MELGALLGELRAADGDVLGAFEARIQERATPVQRASRQACLELHTTPSPSTRAQVLAEARPPPSLELEQRDPLGTSHSLDGHGAGTARGLGGP